MPTRSPATDVATLFSETGVGTLYPGVGIGGTKIYIGTMLDNPSLYKSTVVSLYDSTGTSRQLLNGLFEEDQTVDVRVRGLDYTTTRAKCEEMINRLRDWSKVGGFDYEGSHYLGFTSIALPTNLGVDDRERNLWTFSFTSKREYLEAEPESDYELPSDMDTFIDSSSNS
jgi:hypothetical protein